MLGKIYSTNKEVLKELQFKNINAIQPEFTGTSFDREHENNCKALLNLVPANAKCILLDDGAYLIKTFFEAGRKVVFGVEQTSSGFRKLQNQEIDFPVVNVARSQIKLSQESPLVAKHAFERIQEYMTAKNLLNPSVLVVGLGPVGEAIKQVFQEKNYRVIGFDIKHGHTNLLAVINDSKPDIAIGATGNQILSEDDIKGMSLEHQIYLFSLSSSDREFPVAAFRLQNLGLEPNGIYVDVVYKNITFVNNGFPISFKGNRFELTPPEIEKTICLLGGSVAFGVARGVWRNRVD